MFATYQLLVRYSLIGVVLNGWREPRANTPIPSPDLFRSSPP